MANNLLYLGNNNCYVEHDEQVVRGEFQTIVKVEKEEEDGSIGKGQIEALEVVKKCDIEVDNDLI